MTPPSPGRKGARLAAGSLGLAAIVACLLGPAAAAGSRAIDPAQVVPLDKIPAQHRDAVAEVIRDYTMHRKGAADTFPCAAKVYLSLVNEPNVTLALWKDLADSPVTLRRIDADRYQGTDGAGATATWDYVYRSPKLHVLLSDLDYVSPRGNAKLNGRIVLVVRSNYSRAGNGEPYITHDVEAFVKIDSKGLRALAKTVRPLLDKVLEDQVQEAGWFVSLMGRLVETHPNWAISVVSNQPQIDAPTRTAFRDLVLQSKKPGASAGRPQMAADATADARRR